MFWFALDIIVKFTNVCTTIAKGCSLLAPTCVWNDGIFKHIASNVRKLMKSVGSTIEYNEYVDYVEHSGVEVELNKIQLFEPTQKNGPECKNS